MPCVNYFMHNLIKSALHFYEVWPIIVYYILHMEQLRKRCSVNFQVPLKFVLRIGTQQHNTVWLQRLYFQIMDIYYYSMVAWHQIKWNVSVQSFLFYLVHIDTTGL